MAQAIDDRVSCCAQVLGISDGGIRDDDQRYWLTGGLNISYATLDAIDLDDDFAGLEVARRGTTNLHTDKHTIFGGLHCGRDRRPDN